MRAWTLTCPWMLLALGCGDGTPPGGHDAGSPELPVPADAGPAADADGPVPSRVWKGPPTPVLVDGAPIGGGVESTACADELCLVAVVDREAGSGVVGLWLRRADGAVVGSVDLGDCSGPMASDGTELAVLCPTGLLRVRPDGTTLRVDASGAHAAIIRQDDAYLVADSTPLPGGGEEVQIARLDLTSGTSIRAGYPAFREEVRDDWGFVATDQGPALVGARRALRLSRSGMVVEEVIELPAARGWFAGAASVRGQLLVMTQFVVFDSGDGDLFHVDLRSAAARHLCPGLHVGWGGWQLLPVNDEYYVAARGYGYDRSLVRLDRSGHPVGDEATRDLIGSTVVPLDATRFAAFGRDAEGRLKTWTVEYGEPLPPMPEPVFPEPDDRLPVSGEAFAHAADTVAVALGLAPDEVTVRTRDAGRWSEEARLRLFSSTCATYAGGGTTLAISGDTLVVGAPWDRCADDGHSPDAGAVYVFVRSPAGWTRQALLGSPRAESLARFGASVAVDGDVLVVGERGGAYVFEREGSTWTERAFLVPSTTPVESFGRAAAVSGDTVVLGSPSEEAAYVFVREGSTWVPQARLVTEEPGDGFGESVAVRGDTVAIGAPRGYSPPPGADLDGNGIADISLRTGVVHVFVRAGSGWMRQARLDPPSGPAPGFGARLSIEEDRLVTEHSGSPGRQVLAYERVDGGWRARAALDFAASSCLAEWSFSGRTLVVQACEETSICGCGVPCMYEYVL